MDSIQRIQDAHQRRKAALLFHKEEFERIHGADETKSVGEDEIDSVEFTS